MKKHNRLTIRIATLLVMEFVNGRNFQTASIEGFNRGIEILHANIIQKRLLSPQVYSEGRAIVSTRTSIAPADTNARAQAEAVAPVVNTSSTSKIRSPWIIR